MLSFAIVISGTIIPETTVHATWFEPNAGSYDDGIRVRYGNFGSGHRVYLENIYNGIVLTSTYTAWDSEDGWTADGTCLLYVPKKYGHIKVIPNLFNNMPGVFLGVYAYQTSGYLRINGKSTYTPYIAKRQNMYGINPSIYYEGDYTVVSFNTYAYQNYINDSGGRENLSIDEYNYYLSEIKYTSSLSYIYNSNTSGVLMQHPALDVESITGSASGGGHNWSGSTTATCTSAGVKTCADCGYSESTPALGHIENSGSITTNPTCTTNGVKTFNCSRCGAYLRSASVPASGHSWGSGNGSITQNQTCTLPEIRYNKCTKCSATNGTSQTKSALGHDYQPATLTNNNGVKIEPTVYNDGTYYQKCSRCSTGHSGDPYTNHFNVIPGTQKHFSIYVGDKRVQAIYIGNTPIMNANIGNNSLVA